VDSSTAIPPSVRRTWPVVLASTLFTKLSGRTISGESKDAVDQEEIGEDEDGSGTASDAPGSGTVTPTKRRARATNGSAVATSMAGGRRRKAVRRK
jgi:DnaJ homolog subfamily C member 1